MNVLSEMTTLAFARPAADSDATTVAAWFEAKARLHEHLARQGGADSARASALARSAHRKASALLLAAA